MVLYRQFSVDGADYLYDTATNAIVRLPDGVSPWLDALVSAGNTSDIPVNGSPKRRQAAAFLNRARTHSGLLVPSPARDYRRILDAEEIRARLDHGMRGLLLAVTDRCNQRCSYCIYSGDYVGQRTHGKDSMSWDVARRSIDMFVHRITDARPAFVSFYGGEPLLAWKLVRQCVEYIRTLRISDLTVLVNTNLTLLDESKAAFIAEHDVSLAVSVDGPAPIHNAYRRFANGRPTHARVLHWLHYLREHYPDYWGRNVVLHGTLDKNHDLEAVFDFFCDEAWSDLPNTVGGIRLGHQREYRNDRNANARNHRAIDRLVTRHLQALESGEPFAHRLFMNLLPHVFKHIPARLIGYPPVEAHPMRTCVPGVTRLLVDPRGAFYPCEKTDVPAACIGDIERGIELSRVRHLLRRQVRFCEVECLSCWAWRLCTFCLTHFIERGQIRWRTARRRCAAERERVLHSLERFTYIYNNEPRSTWDHPFSLHHAVAEAKRLKQEGPPTP